jgi:hypothetical protein
VDDEGNVRYSDRIPIDQATKKRQTLSPDGRILETKEAAIPPEQLKREREEKKRQEQEAKRKAEIEARKKAEQQHHDNVLLMTFSTETELLAAKDERLEVINSVIRLLRKNIEKEQGKLESLEKRANDVYISKDRVVPGGLAQNIEYFNEKILGIQQQLELKTEEREKVKKQYAEDLLRYRELTQTQSTTEQTEKVIPAAN